MPRESKHLNTSKGRNPTTTQPVIYGHNSVEGPNRSLSGSWHVYPPSDWLPVIESRHNKLLQKFSIRNEGNLHKRPPLSATTFNYPLSPLAILKSLSHCNFGKR
ncbi:hypothetical protein CDAR_227961 [Caerostris darwini]|uniref:Uncharacterized protein n=1 Tax=Caerostris darwini TaxID=1538125 RepID=A0AAV4VDR0_9ARAC|nr:hypothetical protein CDAR_227961 [Caerostris darwini]